MTGINEFFVLQNNDNITVKEEFSGFLVFYKKSKDEKTAEIQHNLFAKLIQNGLKLSLDNFLFIDFNDQKVRLTTIRKSFKIEKCFLFGINEAEIGINIVIPNNQFTTVADIEFLKTDSPEKLEENSVLKTKLWNQLKISYKIIS